MLTAVIEELDFENEFFHDVEAGLLYYYTNSTMPASDVWEATQIKTLVDINATMTRPATGVTVRGITVALGA